MAYADRTDLADLGINSGALSDIATSAQDKALDACASMIDDAIATGGRYSPPLTAPYPASVVLINCKLAQYELRSVAGYMPDDDDQKTIRERWEDAKKWLERIAAGAAIAGAEDVDQTPGVDESEVVVESDAERGWGFSRDAASDTSEDAEFG